MTALHTRLFGLLATFWGGLLIYFYHSTRVKSYLAMDFHHYILIGGIGMSILGVYSLINPRQKETHEHGHSSCDHDHDHSECEHDDHAHDHHHDHDHGGCETCTHDHADGHGPFITILLTIIPLTLSMKYTEDSYSNSGLAKKGLYEVPVNIGNEAPFTREDMEKNMPKNEHGEFQLRLIQAYYAAGDREIQGMFEDLPVEFEGRIAPEQLNNESGERMRIFRSIITCCAADLQIVGVSLEFQEGMQRPKVDDWVKARGILTFETINGDVLPLLKIREVVPAEEPYSEFRLRQ